MLLRVLTTRVLFALGSVALAQPVAEVAAESPQLSRVTTLVEGLNRPTAVAVRPGSGRAASHLYLADSGTGRILTLSVADSSPEPTEVVRGLTPDATRCLVFRSRNALMVGLAGGEGSPATLCEYDVETDDLPLPADAAKTVLEYDGEGGNFDFSAVARNNESLFVTTGLSNRLLRSKLRGPKPGELKPFIDATEKVGPGAATAAAFSAKGYLVVAHRKEQAGSSQIAFYSPGDASAEPALVVEVALGNIVALAYSPDGDLYVAQSPIRQTQPPAGQTLPPAGQTQPSGVYRIDSQRDITTGKLGSRPTLIAEVAEPTSLAFVGQDSVYVTIHGTETSAGKLLSISLE